MPDDLSLHEVTLLVLEDLTIVGWIDPGGLLIRSCSLTQLSEIKDGLCQGTRPYD